jgi:hypothetical protein
MFRKCNKPSQREGEGDLKKEKQKRICISGINNRHVLKIMSRSMNVRVGEWRYNSTISDLGTKRRVPTVLAPGKVAPVLVP